MPQTVLGIDIGGTKCAVILGEIQNGQVKIIAKKAFPTETQKGFDHSMQAIYRNVDAILFESKLIPNEIAACGISCGGPLDSKKGLIMSPPNLPGWDNIPIVSLIEERFGIRTCVQNDANACALAEWKHGAGKGYNNLIFLTFGTGMGAGLILDGRLYVGASDMAGEVGHIRLNRLGPVGYGKAGSFEGFCSGGGIAQFAQMKIRETMQVGSKVSFCDGWDDLPNVTAKSVAEAAYGGDALALEIYRECGHYLGEALSLLIDVLNPEVIILGSIYGRSQSLIEPAMREVIEREALPYSREVCRIVAAGLGEHIGDYAALSVAAYQLKNE